MQEHEFDEILDFLCGGIILKSERENVRNELFDHLMCRYETNLAVGMDEETARDEAIKNLGDAATVRHQLGAVHSYAPRPTLKKAMNLLVFGYLLSSVQIEFFNGMKEIIIFIGVLCMLVSLFCLSKANKSLKKAFSVNCAAYVTIITITAIQQWGFSFEIFLTVAQMVLSFVSMLFLFGGLSRLVQPYKETSPKKINFAPCVISNTVSYAVMTGFVIIFGVTEEIFLNIIVMAIVLINVIITTSTFVRVSRVLWNSDHEYKIESSAKKKTAFALAAILAIVVPVTVSDYVFSTQKAKTEVYVAERNILENGEREEICSNLLSYGIPDYVVSNLPDSELEMYRGCLNAAEFADETWDFTTDARVGYAGTDYSTGVCGVGLRDEDGNRLVRVLTWTQCRSEGGFYCSSVFWDYNKTQCLPLNYGSEYNDDFLLILSEENGRTMKNKPLTVYVDEDALTDSMTGVRFQMKNDVTVIHAANYNATSQDDNMMNYTVQNFMKCFPVNFVTRLPLDYGNSAGYQNFFEYEISSSGHLLVWEYPPKENQ